MSAPREHWSGRYGFVLASIGGAVGMGNIWRFSYVAGENGGAVFLLVYLACVLLMGIPLMIAELSIGRRTQGDAISAFESENGTGRWHVVGRLAIAAAILLLSYYAVIAGWALKYFVGAATGELWRRAGSDYGGFFRHFISNGGEPLLWQAATLMLAMLVVAAGVQRGIERVNRALIPLLGLTVVVLAAYALSLPGADAGVSFLFAPDWASLRQPNMYVAALGQAFFSLGIGMAFFITYGSYMSRTFPLPASAVIIAAGDTLFAIVAGLAIFPAVFALGGDPAAGPDLAFIALPQVLLKMPAGHLVGAVFFFLLSMAAITSMVALLEIPVAVLTHREQFVRWKATVAVAAATFVLGAPSALGYGILVDIRIGSLGILDAIDHGVSNFLLPAIGSLTALYVGWRLKSAVTLSESDFGDTALGRLWLWLVRVLVPLGIAAILVRSSGTF